MTRKEMFAKAKELGLKVNGNMTNKALEELLANTKEVKTMKKQDQVQKTQEQKTNTTKEEKNMKKENTTNTTAAAENTTNTTAENTTNKKDTRPAITAASNAKLQSNSLDIDADVYDKLAPIMKEEGMKVRRWACNKNLYTFYLGRGQVAEITFRRKDFRVACRPDYAPENYQARKSGYGLDAYTDEAELTAAVAEIANLLDFYKQVQADKKAEKERKAAEKRAAAAKKKAEKEATQKAKEKATKTQKAATEKATK